MNGIHVWATLAVRTRRGAPPRLDPAGQPQQAGWRPKRPALPQDPCLQPRRRLACAGVPHAFVLEAAASRLLARGLVGAARLVDPVAVGPRPHADGVHRLAQLTSHFGQLIVDAWWNRGRHGPRHKTIPFQLPESRRQHFLRNTVNRPLELRETLRSLSELADDVDRPLAADLLQHVAYRRHFFLAVGKRGGRIERCGIQLVPQVRKKCRLARVFAQAQI